jgi:hypothetical protein
MRFFKLLGTFLFFALAGIYLTGYGAPAIAQTATPDDDAYAQQFAVELLQEPTIKDEYVEGNMTDLARLYWTLEKFDIEDADAINNFLLITECELYQKFRNDEFEWSQIFAATQKYITDNVSVWPTTFEIMIPITLGRYDIERQVFNVNEDSWFKGARRLDVNQNRRRIRLCGVYTSNLKNYPPNIILTLDKPFTLTEIPMAPELANLYIMESNRRFDNLPASLKIARYKRFSYLRLKVRIYAYQRTGREGGGLYEKVHVTGRLEGVEVYADPNKTKLLYSKDVPKDRQVRRKRQRGEPEREDTEPPSVLPQMPD